MIFSSLSKREKTIFYISCLLIGSSLLYNFILEPFIKKWFNLDGELSIKEAKLQKWLKVANKYKYVDTEYKMYESLVKSSLSDEQEMAGILSEIEELASKSNVYINVLKPHAIKNMPFRSFGPVRASERKSNRTENLDSDINFYKKLVVEIELDTTVKDLTRFLYELQNSPKMLKIDRMEINAKFDQKDAIKSYLLISRVLFKT